jgi:hypothetical protein
MRHLIYLSISITILHPIYVAKKIIGSLLDNELILTWAEVVLFEIKALVWNE